VLLVNSVHIDGSLTRLQKNPLQILNNDCDPYPFLQETTEQLTYKTTGVMEQTIKINHAAALREVGRYQDALDLLNSINIDRYSGTVPVHRFVYYHNLTDILSLVGNYSEAEVWYQKAVQIYQDMPENKLKQNLRPLVEAMAADAWFRRGEYEKAIECSKALYPTEPCNQINQAMLIARCYIALGQPEEARKPLEFVVAKGNRLHAVAQARAMLNNTIQAVTE
jgi:tetratricopeptide (TPR) repeat protein